MGGRDSQHRRRIGQAALVEIQVEQAEETLQLLLGERMVAFVGAGEMADQVQLAHTGMVAQARMPGAQRGRIEAQAVHAGVELEPDVEWNIQAGGEERLALFRALDHQVQAQLPGEGVFARLEAAFQQQDARAGVQGADFRGLLQAGHGEAIGIVVQRGNHFARTVAIGVRLDHRERLALRRAALGQGIVVANGGKVDGGNEGTHGIGSCN